MKSYMEEGFGTNRFYEAPPQLTPEQVEQLPFRILNILTSLHRGYGIDGRGPDEGAVAFGQMMLGELFKDLDINLAALYRIEIVDDNWKFDDLPEYAVLPIPAIASAPNLTHDQKTKLLALYPTLLTNSGMTWTYMGGKSQVLKKLKAIKLGNLESKIEQHKLINAVEHQWRSERIQRFKGFLGSIVSRQAP